MKKIKMFKFFSLIASCCLLAQNICAQTNGNQTDTVSPVQSGQLLPFNVQIELADFQLPFGLHSYASANVNGKWLLLAGITNGLHGFNDNPNNFPPSTQNNILVVVDSKSGKVYQRALTDPDSGLTLDQIESLSVISPQSYQTIHPETGRPVLYMTGGYGFKTLANNFITWPVLTAIDIEGLMDWVIHPHRHKKACQYIRQIYDALFAITGGYMSQIDQESPTLLCLGQNFEGTYLYGFNTQVYSEQIRAFKIKDRKCLSVEFIDPNPLQRDPNLRRRDLNVCRTLYRKPNSHKLTSSLVAFSGVFTETNGIWTVPVVISSKGQTFMANPAEPSTFKQAMNNYACATVGLYSRQTNEMYTIFLGGLSYGYFSDGQFMTDPEIPFINQVTAIKSVDNLIFNQYLLNTSYPLIPSQGSNPGNPLLFGTGSTFFDRARVSRYTENVLKLDKLKDSEVMGYIVGGIASTLPNTNQSSDSAASPFIFKVKYLKNE